ncbi:hypothetical protein E4U31_000515 [Claviceps sp. LM219 group G6]|nr:hypothetical protein E4U31_000515 [Claviceps sp. LM219 group G6]
MFGRFAGFSQSLRLPHSFFRRQFSVRAIYSSFPATLHYSSPSRNSALYDYEEAESRLDGSLGEAVKIHKDGLVYPTSKTTMSSNGVTFYPNTFLLQEVVRQHFDYYLECKEEGKQAEKRFVFTIFKGTPIPSDLILLNDWLANLNRTLDEFYNKHALKENADDWLAKHPYKDAVAEENEEVWMAK